MAGAEDVTGSNSMAATLRADQIGAAEVISNAAR
jgi:hypothetical protein